APTAGMVLKWFRDEFCHEEKAEALRTGADPYDLMTAKAAKINPGAGGLVMLPHLMGTGSPEFNPHARGTFAGISLGMTRGHFIRAIMESVACSVENNLSAMKKKNISFTEIRMLGGASRSPLWNQMIADITGIPVTSMAQSENASLGAAILAGTGTGIFNSMESACRICIKTGDRYLPDPASTEFYNKQVYRYNQLYHHLENYWEKD
ncbi:MAG: FGGY-family carbohydrate kinase, partial [Bacteroidota bacterium]